MLSLILDQSGGSNTLDFAPLRRTNSRLLISGSCGQPQRWVFGSRGLGGGAKSEIHNDKFISREVSIFYACISNQLRKPPARKLSVLPHAKPLLRCAEPVTSNIECAPRPVLK
jgi:hypothetical protein